MDYHPSGQGYRQRGLDRHGLSHVVHRQQADYPAGVLYRPVPAGGKLGHNALNWSVSLMLIALLLALYGGYLWHLWPTT